LNLFLKIDTTNFEKAHLSLWQATSGSYALRQGKKLLVKASFKAQKKLSDKLLPAIIKLIKKAGISLKDLSLVEVAKSETGSFTGQRVGMAVAKALGFGLGIKVKLKG